MIEFSMPPEPSLPQSPPGTKMSTKASTESSTESSGDQPEAKGALQE